MTEKLLEAKRKRTSTKTREEQIGKVYLVPVDEVGTTRAHLRLEPSKNNQEKNVRWASDYEL